MTASLDSRWNHTTPTASRSCKPNWSTIWRCAAVYVFSSLGNSPSMTTCTIPPRSTIETGVPSLSFADFIFATISGKVASTKNVFSVKGLTEAFTVPAKPETVKDRLLSLYPLYSATAAERVALPQNSPPAISKCRSLGIKNPACSTPSAAKSLSSALPRDSYSLRVSA